MHETECCPWAPASGSAGVDAQLLDRARRCYSVERFADALHIAIRALNEARRGRVKAEILSPDRDAAALVAWALHHMRRYGGCRRWLTHAHGGGLIAGDDPEFEVIALWLDIEEGAYDAALARIDVALAALRGRVTRFTAEYLFLRGRALSRLGHLREAGEELETAAAIFRQTGWRDKLALTCNALGILYMQQCRHALSREWFSRSMAIHEELGLSGGLARNRLNAAILGYKTGDYASARADCESAMAEFERLGLVTSACRARLALGNIERLCGDFAVARRHLMAAHMQARRLRLAREQCLVLEFLGDVLRDEGRPGEARRYYARGLAIARKIAPDGDLMVELLRRDAECRTLLGRPADGLAILDDALHRARRLGDRFEEGVIMRCRAAALAETGAHQAAQVQIEGAIACLLAIDAKHELGVAQLQAAELLLAKAGGGQLGGRRGAIA